MHKYRAAGNFVLGNKTRGYFPDQWYSTERPLSSNTPVGCEGFGPVTLWQRVQEFGLAS